VLFAICGFAALAQNSHEPASVQVAVGLDTKSATANQIAQAIREQLNTRGVSATDQDVQRAARGALNLLNRARDPQKGVIYIHTRKFTVCASWGKDKNFCKSH
jgi:hypothetical protein